MDALDWSLPDLVFLGDPFCRISPGSVLSSEDELKGVLKDLQEDAGRVVFSLPVAPVESEVGFIDKALALMSDSGVYGVEVQSHAMAYRVHRMHPSLKIFFGSFANVYTDLCADEMEKMGVEGGCLPFELDRDEIVYILKSTGMDVVLPVFGRFPVAFAQSCYFHPDEILYPFDCSGECGAEVLVEYKNGAKVLQKGRALYSFRALNLVSHLPELLNAGLTTFRVECLQMAPESVNRALGTLKGALGGVKNDEPFDAGEIDKKLKIIAPWGFCNGLFFGLRGFDYVPGC